MKRQLCSTVPCRIKTFLLFIACLTGIYTSQASSEIPEREINRLLKELDATLDNSAIFVEARKSRITLLEEMLSNKSMSDEQRYQINLSLYHEYSSFRFDESLACLQANIDVARRLGSRDKLDETNIMLAWLYTMAGMYFEAGEIFEKSIDLATLSPSLRTKYYLAKQNLYHELAHYSKQEQIIEDAWRQYRHYSELLFGGGISGIDNQSFDAECSHGVYLMSQGKFDQAEQLYKHLLEQTEPQTHDYAIVTYRLGEICDQTKRPDEMVCWYARSAIADIHSATKDNASLCSLANQLFGRNDIMRAFRYIRCSMDDAIFYNAKLRPWQVAASMPYIESAAQEMVAQREKQMRTFTLIISILVICLFVACVYLWRLYRQTRENQEILRERHRQVDAYNHELSELNKAISEANHVKEEYIGLFLSICSSYIDRLADYQRNVRRKLTAGKIAELQKEASSSALVNEETKKFYEMFDTAFLRLYPTFVEDFNSLLEDSEHIVLHKGELLNTELRIFALIRLGITDSSKIASLLRYSVNTIYNYRAKVKNKSKYQRDDFEERVKHISSFKIAE